MLPFSENENVSCFSDGSSHISALRKAVFRCGLFVCVRPWPVNPKHNLKSIARGAHMRTLCASRKAQTSDVSCRGGEARRGKSHCTKHRPPTRMFLCSALLPRGSAASWLGHTSDSTSSTRQAPPVLCNHYLAALLTHPPPSPYHLPLSFWHQITLCNKSSYCRLLIIYPPDHAFHWIIATVIHVSDNPSPGEHLLW